MPFVETEGGFGGGLARGLTAGLNLGNQMVNQAQERAGQAQDRDLRERQYGLQVREQGRLDNEERLRLHTDAMKEIDQQMQGINQGMAGYAQAFLLAQDKGASEAQLAAINNDPGLQALTRQMDNLRALREQHFVAAYGPLVVDGHQEALRTAAALKNGDKTLEDLSPQEAYRVVALTGQDPEHFLPDDSGQSKIGQHMEDFHNAADAGSWSAAATHAANILLPYVSPHAPDHDLHYQGFGSRLEASSNPNEAHPHIGSGMDAIGQIGTVNAAISSNPDLQQKIQIGAQQGGREERNLALQMLYQNGGSQALSSKLLQPHPLEQDALDLEHQIRRAYPTWSPIKVSAEALARLKPNEQQLKDAQATADYARAHLDNITAQYTASGKSGLWRGTDGVVYHKALSGGLEDEDGNAMPAGVTASPLKGGANSGRPTIGHRTVRNGIDTEEVPYAVELDPKTGQPIGYRDLPKLNDQPGAGQPAPQAQGQGTPTLSEFMVRARQANPGVSDAYITDYYRKKYGNP